MIKNYFKIAWRNIWKNRIFSAINIFGLAVGMAAFIVIMLFVAYEKSFDSFHAKNIYRLNEVQYVGDQGSSQKVALSMFPMGPALKQEYPEIRNFTRIHWSPKYQMTFDNRKVFLPQTFFVDSTFFKIFDFPLIQGDVKTALLKPHSAVITASTAKQLFGNDDPIGKIITHYGTDTVSFTVTGVMADIPKNSQLQFDAAFSFSSIYKPWMFGNWGGNWLNTYLDIDPKANVEALNNKKFPEFIKRHLGKDGPKFMKLFTLPLKDVHANSADIGLDYINYQKFDKKYTALFGIIALIVLVIACVNFINLSTARSAERSREVGIRKSIGAHRFQLAAQFLGETVMISFMALILALGFVELALPYINNLSERDISLPIFNNLGFIASILGGTILVGIISGIYPAIYLSSFQAVKVLKGSVQVGKNKGALRNILVVTQFSSAVFLMIATIFVLKQLNYMQKQDPGYSRDQVVNIPIDGVTTQKYDLLKSELSSSSLIQGVTASQDILGSHMDQTGVQFTPANGPQTQLGTTLIVVDNNYLNFYKMKLVAGNYFSPNKAVNARQYIINEALAHELLKNPKAPYSSLIGDKFGIDSLGTIVGVAKDFNFNSLHYKIEPVCLFSQTQWGFRDVSVKISGGQTSAALAFIKSKWQSIYPDYPFEYQFLDDHFNEVYKADNQVTQIVGILAGLTIFISCLGLFGLASYSAEKRIKEIGVRKVLGASVQNIVFLLASNFLLLVFIAIIIAVPIAWYLISIWLRGFAYRIDIQWWVFLLAGAAAVTIAFATVSFQSIKAAIANPVKSLRSE